MATAKIPYIYLIHRPTRQPATFYNNVIRNGQSSLNSDMLYALDKTLTFASLSVALSYSVSA